MRKFIATALVGGSLFLTGCGFEWPDPCADAPTPSAVQIDQVEQGFEVDWGDCELGTDGKWFPDN